MSKAWNWILVKLGLRIDWTDADNAPPFVSEVPHEYQTFSNLYDGPGKLPQLPCCARCGGGSKHPIHHGKQTAYAGARLSDKAARAMTEAPDDGLPFGGR